MMGGFYTIPTTEDFSLTLVDFIDQMSIKDNIPLSQIKIYVPTRRAIRTLKDAFLRRSEGKPRILPIIQAIGDSDEDEVSFLTSQAVNIPPAIDGIERQIILARFLEKTWPDHYSFTNVLPIAGELGRLIDQIHTEDISLEALSDLVDLQEFAEHWEITVSFLRTLLQEIWPQYLQSVSKIDAGLHRRLKIQSVADFYRDYPPRHPVIIAGSTGSHPAMRALINVVRQNENGFVFLPALDQVMDDHTWLCVAEGHPQYFLKKLLDICKVERKNVRPYACHAPDQNRLFTISEMMRPAEKTDAWQGLVDPLAQDKISKGINNITLCGCDNEDHEARTIALSMAEIAADLNQEKTCVLITPDRDLSARVQSHLRQWGIVCDDSAGQSLQQTSIGRFALSALECEQAEQIYPVSFLATLKNSLAGGGNFENFRTHLRHFEKDILRGVRPNGPIHDLKKQTDKNHDFIDHIVALFKPLTSLSNVSCSVDDWLKAHIQTLENIAKTSEKDGASRLWVGYEGEALAQFFEKIQGCAGAMPKLNQDGYREFMSVMMKGVEVRPPYGTHPRLKILGQIEARMASADRVILAGLNEGIWPPESGFDTWMSRPMRAKFGLPSLEQKTTLAAHDLASALGGAEVFLTFSKRRESQTVLPSRWIQRMDTLLTAAKIDKIRWPDIKGGKYIQWADELHKAKDVRSCMRPTPTPSLDRRPTQFSITDIERWMRDPYALYAKKILRLKKLKNIDEDMSVADKGTLIHAVMEKFTKIQPQKLSSDALGDILKIGKDVFVEQSLSPEIHGLWWPRFEKAARWMIAHEDQWRKETMQIESEKECLSTLKINDIEYILTGKADRFEKRTGDTYALIDYKTGGVPATKDVVFGIASQLPLEAYSLCPDGSCELHYWSLSGAGTGGKASIAQGQKGEDGQTLAQEAGEGLRALMTVFADEKTPYLASPDPTVMINANYNDYAHLERIAEWSVIDGDDG